MRWGILLTLLVLTLPVVTSQIYIIENRIVDLGGGNETMLELRGSVNITGFLYANGSEVCTQDNGLCAGGGYDWDFTNGTEGGAITDAETFTLVPGRNMSILCTGNQCTFHATDTSGGGSGGHTNLTSENVSDIVGLMVSGNTEERISVDYQDSDNTLDFVVTSTLSSYTDDLGHVEDNHTWNETYADTLYADISVVDTDTNCSALGSCVNVSYMEYENVGNYNITGNMSVDHIYGLGGALGVGVSDDGSDITLHAEASGVNSFFIATDGTFIEMVANPGPSNDDLMISFEESQGVDTVLNIYEGGTGNNRWWNSGSTRIGGPVGSLCSNLNGIGLPDCDTPLTGADLVVQDDGWFGGSVKVGNATLNITDEGDIVASGDINATGMHISGTAVCQADGTDCPTGLTIETVAGNVGNFTENSSTWTACASGEYSRYEAGTFNCYTDAGAGGGMTSWIVSNGTTTTSITDGERLNLTPGRNMTAQMDGANITFHAIDTDTTYSALSEFTNDVGFLENGSDANFGQLNATSWTNVTITESQITDLTHTTDTDTNASTGCGANEFLGGATDGCIDISGWDQDASDDAVDTNWTATVNATSSFGGEVSGTYDNIILAHDALDDQYYDSEADLTGLLDDNYLGLGGGTLTSNLFVQGFVNATDYGNFSELYVAGTLVCRQDGTNCPASGSGSMNTVKEDDGQVGGSDIVTLDFQSGFDVAESPDTEVQISLDLTEITVDANTLDGLLAAYFLNITGFHAGNITSGSIPVARTDAKDTTADTIADDDVISDTELDNEDFGEFTCTGAEDGCTLDTGTFDDEYVELGDSHSNSGGEATVSGAYNALVITLGDAALDDQYLEQDATNTLAGNLWVQGTLNSTGVLGSGNISLYNAPDQGSLGDNSTCTVITSPNGNSRLEVCN